MSNLGDIRVGQILYCHFTTRQFTTGTPLTSASLAVSVYKDDNVTQSTSGITTTFTTGFDGVAGLVSVKIDTSADGTFYAAGHDFSLVITAGTVDSVSIVGENVHYFSIENRSALMPTTGGRKLDVSAGGEAGLDWANVGGQSTSVNLSATTTNLVNTVTTYTGDTPQTGDAFARIGVAGVGLTNVVLPAGGLANVTAWTVAITGNITGNLSGSVGSVTGLTASNLDAAVSSRMATYVQPTGFLTATFPATVSSYAGGAVASVTGSVGSVVGLTASNLDTTVSSRLADADYTAPDNAGIVAIKAQTDLLAFSTLGLEVDIVGVNEVAITGTGTSGDPWGPA